MISKTSRRCLGTSQMTFLTTHECLNRSKSKFGSSQKVPSSCLTPFFPPANCKTMFRSLEAIPGSVETKPGSVGTNRGSIETKRASSRPVHNPDEPEPKRFKLCYSRKNLYLTVYHCAAYVLIGGLQIIFRNPQSVKKNI